MKDRFLQCIVCIPILFAFLSCSKTFYNVKFVDRPLCDTTHGKLFIRIKNESKFGITSLSIDADSGLVECGGIGPKETTCYFPSKQIYSEPSYSILILRFNVFGKAMSWGMKANEMDEIGETKIQSGFYTVTISIIKSNHKYKVDKFSIKKD